MLDKINKYKIILGSNSPRRKEILLKMGINFIVRSYNDNEKVPKKIIAEDHCTFLAKKKSDALKKQLNENEILITADTTVVIDNIVLNKPKDAQNACEMLRKISGKEHLVITGVCLANNSKQFIFSEKTQVKFQKLNEKEIQYYIKKYQPFDKAGSYGIQEWIGLIGVESIDGSYTNVVGLPSSRLYNELNKFI